MTVLEFNNKFINIEDNLERFALSLTFNEEEAKKLMQETYLKALTYMNKIVEFGNIKAWMFTIMKNTFINSYRKSGSFDNKKDFLLLNNLQESQLFGTDSEVTYKKINTVIDALKNELKIPLMILAEGYQYHEMA